MSTREIRIEYASLPGKNLGLHFEGLPFAVYERLKGYISRNVSWLDEPDFEVFKRAGLFFQSDTYGTMLNAGRTDIQDDPESYLFLEFWSESDKHADCALKILARTRQMVRELASDLKIEVSGEAAVRMHQALYLLRQAYAEEGFKPDLVPHTVLMRFADKIGEEARAPLRDALQVMLPAIDLALAMGSISGPAPMIKDIERGRALAHLALEAPDEEARAAQEDAQAARQHTPKC